LNDALRKQSTGRIGEEIAARFLEHQGLAIVTRNWRCREGELDIVAREGGELVFVEVRTRRRRDCLQPSEWFPLSKRRKLLAAAQTYMQEAGEVGARFDVIGVVLAPRGPEITHYREAFGEE
jgi:putative endonuclease